MGGEIDRPVRRDMRQHAMELAYRGEPGREAVEHHPHFGIAEGFGGASDLAGLHADQPAEKRQAVGDPMIGFRDQVRTGRVETFIYRD